MKTIEQKREEGKLMYFHLSKDDPEFRQKGLNLLSEAANEGDAEAMYIISVLLLQGKIKTDAPNIEEHALRQLLLSAKAGFLPARSCLLSYYGNKYDNKIAKQYEETLTDGPLRDFENKIIKIDRSGLLVPVDAKLEYIDGENLLTFSLNVAFMGLEDLDCNEDKFKQSVIEGIKAWEGKYQVFGGQHVNVKIELTMEDRIYDSVFVMPLPKETKEVLSTISNKVAWNKEKIKAITEQNRSFATTGIKKWSVKSPKIIYLQTEDMVFDNQERIKNIIKHEFGHVLGLGDLYPDQGLGLTGVERGNFVDIDCFHIVNGYYYSVMCLHDGPITNNDIEMVILAFSENEVQNYQKLKKNDKISKALGRGN